MAIGNSPAVPANRIPCCVPFCRRTAPGSDGEIICGSHWRLIPKVRRRAFRRASKRMVTAIEVGAMRTTAPGECGIRIGGIWRTFDDAGWDELHRAKRSMWRLWGRIKRDAIERAAGL